MKKQLIIISIGLLLFASDTHAQLKEVSVAALKNKIKKSLTVDINALSDAQTDAWQQELMNDIERVYPSDPPSRRIFLTQMFKKLGDREEYLIAGGRRGGRPGRPVDGGRIELPEAEPTFIFYKPGSITSKTKPILDQFNTNPQQSFEQLKKWLLEQQTDLEKWITNPQVEQDLKRREFRDTIEKSFNDAYREYSASFNKLLALEEPKEAQGYQVAAAIAMVFTLNYIIDLLKTSQFIIKNADQAIKLMALAAGNKLAEVSAESNTLSQLLQDVQSNPNTLLDNTNALLPIKDNLTSFKTPGSGVVIVDVIKPVITATDEELIRYQELIEELDNLLAFDYLTLNPDSYENFINSILQKREELDQLAPKVMKIADLEKFPSVEQYRTSLNNFKAYLKEQTKKLNEIIKSLTNIPIVYDDAQEKTINWPETEKAVDEWEKNLDEQVKQLPEGFRNYLDEKANDQLTKAATFLQDLKRAQNKPQQDLIIKKEQQTLNNDQNSIKQEIQKAGTVNTRLLEINAEEFINSINNQGEINKIKLELQSLIDQLQGKTIKAQLQQKLNTAITSLQEKLFEKKQKEERAKDLAQITKDLKEAGGAARKIENYQREINQKLNKRVPTPVRRPARPKESKAPDYLFTEQQIKDYRKKLTEEITKQEKWIHDYEGMAKQEQKTWHNDLADALKKRRQRVEGTQETPGEEQRRQEREKQRKELQEEIEQAKKTINEAEETIKQLAQSAENQRQKAYADAQKIAQQQEAEKKALEDAQAAKKLEEKEKDFNLFVQSINDKFNALNIETIFVNDSKAFKDAIATFNRAAITFQEPDQRQRLLELKKNILEKLLSVLGEWVRKEFVDTDLRRLITLKNYTKLFEESSGIVEDLQKGLNNVDQLTFILGYARSWSNIDPKIENYETLITPLRNALQELLDILQSFTEILIKTLSEQKGTEESQEIFGTLNRLRGTIDYLINR